MKAKYLFCFFSLYSLSAEAAFSKIENKQLQDINVKSDAEVKLSIDSLNKAIDEQIENNPEMKDVILNLKKSWFKTTDIKCKLETFDSKGTDAELSAVNKCLIKNYTEESKYFNNMLP